MKVIPRKLALAGLIGALISGAVSKVMINVLSPESPEAQIVIPFFEQSTSRKNIVNGKIVSITTSRPVFIPSFINIYIVLLVAGTFYNKKEF